MPDSPHSSADKYIAVSAVNQQWFIYDMNNPREQASSLESVQILLCAFYYSISKYNKLNYI